MLLPLYSAPFTVQRLCEVALEPERYYETAAKLTRGIRKVCDDHWPNVPFSTTTPAAMVFIHLLISAWCIEDSRGVTSIYTEA